MSGIPGGMPVGESDVQKKIRMAAAQLQKVGRGDAAAQLVQQRLHRGGGQPARHRVHVLFQVIVEVLKHQRQLAVRVLHVVQAHDVAVRVVLEDGDLRLQVLLQLQLPALLI